MITFEIIILTALYLFAFGYMVNCLGLFEEDNTWMDNIGIVLVAATFGAIAFPIIFAEDIWAKLNN